MYKVVILQHRLLHYRMPLFEQLRAKCLTSDIDLHLVHGQPTRRELPKKDVGYIEWANTVTNYILEVGARDWLWQPLPHSLKNADLVIVMQESRLLSNYPLLLNRLWSKRKVAYWGHGVNFQSDKPDGFKEKWKKLLINKVDWWFAYTQLTVDILSKSGYPSHQITCLNNAIDTHSFKQQLLEVSDNELSEERKLLDIEKDAPVGIFCGSLYPEKKLDFLVAAIDLIKEQSPLFHCIFLGDGPSMPYLKEATLTRPWLHLLGVTKGTKKALYFRMADFMLNPGLVGLHIVDAFCAGLVMTTTTGALHSPEIAYLKPGINGIMTEDNVEIYANAVLSLINDKKTLAEYKANSLASADEYSLENMVDNFMAGINKCLK